MAASSSESINAIENDYDPRSLAVFTDPKSNLKFVMVKDTAVFDDFEKNGIAEYSLIDWSKQFLSSEGVFIDVGAHCGTYSLILAEKCKQVYAFECSALTCKGLNLGIMLNNKSNVKAYNFALGDTEEDKTLHIFSPDGGSNSLLTELVLDRTPDPESYLDDQSNHHQKKEPILTEKVAVRTLDSFNFTEVEFIKIDTEGYELEVIKGAIDTLNKNFFPPILFEAWNEQWYQQKKEQLFVFLKGLGYKIVPISGYPHMFLAADHPVRVALKKSPLEILESKYFSTGQTSIGNPSDLLELGKHFENHNNYYAAYQCYSWILELLGPDVDPVVYQRLSSVIYYTHNRSKSLEYAEKALFSKLLSFNDKNHIIGQLQYYIEPLSVIRRIKLDLPALPGYLSSSASLIAKDDNYLMVVRTVNYRINSNNGSYLLADDGVVRTINYLVDFDHNFQLSNIRKMEDLSDTPKFDCNIVGMEDVRIFSDSQFLCTSLDVNSERIPQICYGNFTGCSLADQNQINVEKLIPLQPNPTIDCQKNWLPFIDNGIIKFIYCYDPLTIYQFDNQTHQLTKVFEKRVRTEDLSSFRGSAGLIAYHSGWLGTIHQVHYHNPRKYFTRFVRLSSDFEVLEFSKPFYFHLVGIEFNAGIAIHPDGIILTYSVLDNTTNVVLVDHSVVDKLFN